MLVAFDSICTGILSVMSVLVSFGFVGCTVHVVSARFLMTS